MQATLTHETETYGRFDVARDEGTSVAVHYDETGSVTYAGRGGNNWRAGYVCRADGGWLAVPIIDGRMTSPKMHRDRADAVAFVMVTADNAPDVRGV